MPAFDPASIQTIVAVLGLLGSIVVAWWRITAELHRVLGVQTELVSALDRLRAQVTASVKRATERLDTLSRVVATLDRDVSTMTALVSEREKDTSRLEGQLEQLGGMVVKQVAAVNSACGSLDAVWRTLQTLHPERVPKRASDRS